MFDLKKKLAGQRAQIVKDIDNHRKKTVLTAIPQEWSDHYDALQDSGKSSDLKKITLEKIKGAT